jgi:hypothetical protein
VIFISGIDRQILNIVFKIRRRMKSVYAMNTSLVFVSVALLIGVLLSVIARFVPVYNVYLKTGIIAGIALIVGICFGLYKGPKMLKAALRADSLGLSERTVTAVELIGVDTPMALMQKRDALDYLSKVDYKRKISPMPNKKYLSICLLLGLSLVLAGFIPNPMEEKARVMHELKQDKAKQVKEVEKMVKKIDKSPTLTKEQKKEIETKLAEIKKDINLSESKNELHKALQKSEKKMELIKQEYEGNKDNLEKIVDTLSKFKSTKNLANLIKSNDKNAMKQSLNQLSKELKNLNEDQIKELAKSLSSLANDIKNNAELKAALSQLSNKMAESGMLSEGDLNNLSESLSKLMENEDFSQALSDIAQQLNNMQSQYNKPVDQGASGNGEGMSGNGQNGNNGKNGQSGQNGQNGQGKGSGSGAGNGTDIGQENVTPIAPGFGLNKKDSSEKKLGEYEKIFTPQTIGGEGEKSQLKGNKNNNGSNETVVDKAQTYKGEAVPYNKVLGQYREQAMESINTSDIPEGMKEIVKSYFESIDE